MPPVSRANMHFTPLSAAIITAIPAVLAASPTHQGDASVHAPASDTTGDGSWILAGPASYADVQGAVAGLKAAGNHPNSLVGRGADQLAKRVCEGVYLCDGAGFSGSCYYGCYPISTGIRPDPYWVSRLVSAGPDEGGWCDFYGGGDCDPSKFVHTIFQYPGGDLPGGIADNLGCFYCNPS